MSLMSLLTAVLCLLALSVLVQAQDQSGFLSIDCGIPEDAGYTDENTGISYVSDIGFTDTGIGKTTSPEYQSTILGKQFSHVRSFPDGRRNCFSLRPPSGQGSKYLIRARFRYGDYDAKNKLPGFELHLGVNVWDSVKLKNASTVTDKEIIHVLTSDKIEVCLVNTGEGTPFISALELRLLNSSIYVSDSGSLVNILRLDLASLNNKILRHEDDIYDRIWSPALGSPEWGELNTSKPVDALYSNRFNPPGKAMQTAITTLNNSDALALYWKPDDPSSQVYFYLHFAEIQERKGNQSREFNIYINGNLFYGPVSPAYLYTNTIYSQSPPQLATDFTITLNSTKNSTLPPIINAVEIYVAKLLLQSQTVQDEVDAVLNIKKLYGVKKNWEGDPCVPKAYSWDGLNCSYDGYYPPRIISLNLSSSGLTGEIAPYILNLSLIQSLDMSNNKLTGRVPVFLSRLTSLETLILTGNNFTGSLPAELIERSNNGSMSLSVDENLCLPLSCKNSTTNSDNQNNQNNNNNNNDDNDSSSSSKKKVIIALVASVAAVVTILGALAVLWLFKKKRRVKTTLGKVHKKPKTENVPLESRKRQFTHFEILSITNNFERIIGRGGSGTVYHGYLDLDTQVAVKMLSPSSVQGYEQFRTEAKLLMRVHHRNLTILVGYCNEGTNLGLIYEHMANGNLEDSLFGSKNGFTWEKRLQIAIDAAQGLEYLHHGCRPPIIHRDVKSTNILLDKDFQAKLADFGLSKVFPPEVGTHVSTRVIGTPGYLDPEYYVSNWLNEKSDVFSFGVVILELLTGRPAIGRDPEKTHVIQWVTPLLESGEIREIPDPRLRGEFEVNSVWKVVELAMTCVALHSAERPTMNYVVMELKECLALEKARVSGGHRVEERIPSEPIPPMVSIRNPSAR